jgi:hypothetical protein
MNPVVATKRESTEEFFAQQTPGAFYIKKGGRRIHCECPCGCGGFMNLPIHLEGETPTVTSWWWDGNYDKPTLRPSIRDMAACRFHGHLTEGVWTFEGDSGVVNV